MVEAFDALAAGRTVHPDFAPQLAPPPEPPAERGSPTAAAAAAVAEAEARAPQLPFLRQLCGTMAAAGYRLLTRQEWEAALCENFLCTLPVAANYGAMDATLLPAALYAEGGPAAGEPPPQLAGRALIWHRGADTVWPLLLPACARQRAASPLLLAGAMPAAGPRWAYQLATTI